MTRRLVNPLAPSACKNPFQISIAENKAMHGFDVMLQVGGLDDKTEAEAFANAIADWMIAGGGWKARSQ